MEPTLTKRGRRGGANKNSTAEKEKDTEVLRDDGQSHKKTRRSKQGKSALVQEQPENTINFREAAPASTKSNSYQCQFGIPDSDSRSYFKGIEEMLVKTDQFDSREDQEMFLENVYNEVNGKELMLATDFDTSRILERLLRQSTDFQVRVFTDRLNGSYKALFPNQFGSHVCQTLLKLAVEIVDREMYPVGEKDPKDDGSLPTMEKCIVEICEQLSEYWSEFLTDSYGSHVMRTLLNILSGEQLTNDTDIRSEKSKQYNKHFQNIASSNHKACRYTPPSFATALQVIVKSVSEYLEKINLKVLALHPIANPMLQILIGIPGSGDTLIRNLLTGADSVDFVNTLTQDKVGSHLLEKIIETSESETFKILYKTHFKHRILELFQDNIGNFVLQKVIKHLHSEKQLKQVMAVLSESYSKMLYESRSGILIQILESAANYPDCQSVLMSALISCLNCAEDDRIHELCYLILYRFKWDKLQVKWNIPSPSVPGSLILQKLLLFSSENVRVLTDSIAKVPKETLMIWIKDQVCSRFVESLLTSATVSKKSKRDLVALLSGSFAELADNKFASHVLDKCWLSSNMEFKESIALELAAKEKQLKDSFHGKFVLRNFKIEMFKRDKQVWLNQLKTDTRKRKDKTDLAVKKVKPINEIDEMFATKSK